MDHLPSTANVTINPERLLGDLRRLREFGACGIGVIRQSLSPIDIESRRWLRERLQEAGLDARIDGVGTVFGRSRNPGWALLVGSHTDTQPRGGWLDGAMGVIYGLEVARALAECEATRDLAIDVASWIDEEGAFATCLGSQTFCGEVAPGGPIRDAANDEGKSLGEALREAGLEGAPVERCEPGRYVGYAEAHIEQGPWLEHQGKRIGAVSGIVGSRNFTVAFESRRASRTTPAPPRWRLPHRHPATGRRDGAGHHAWRSRAPSSSWPTGSTRRFRSTRASGACGPSAGSRSTPGWLEHQGKRIGAVSGIVGSRNFTVAFAGQQNHAGTTPMALRRDAGHALVELAHRVYETFPEHAGERSVWTIGRIALDPGVQSIVPGRAEMHLQFRDQDESVLERLETHARALAAEADARGRAEVRMNEVGKRSIPAMMDERLRACIERAAEHHAPGDWITMPSAAIHDAQVLARHMPAAMMFVPSIGGVSHAFEEDTSDEDIVLGCQVFATAAANMLLD